MHRESVGKLTSGIGRQLLLLVVAFTMAACDGLVADDETDTPPNNVAPLANAGSDQNVLELTVVNLVGSATDANGDTLTYSWTQTGGTTVTLNTPDSAAASFTAPDVAAGSPQVLTFQLTATDPAGLSSSDSIDITVQEPAATVTTSGNLFYEFPPPNRQPGSVCRGLDFANLEMRPIRRATVQLLDSTGTSIIDSTVSDDSGAYSFTMDASTDYIIRVRAELKSASWDVEVRNNVDDPLNPMPIGQRPIYVMDLAFNSGVADNPNNDLTAATGWNGTTSGDVYDAGARVAAPFSVLDSIYSAMLLVTSVDPNATFPPLDAFWSPDNTTAQPNGQDRDTGEIGTSFYTNDQLFLLGKDGDDAEEFDDHVIVHEWGHYFEDNFSRSDSIGGSHGVGDILDKRVAFGEGFATALSGMALNDPDYCDTLWFGGNLSGFRIDIEGGNPGDEGWYNELSVLKILYDLWDNGIELTADTSSIGFGPIYNVMTGPQSTTGAFTSIFSFATYLKLEGTGQNAFIDALLNEQNITANSIDIYGSTEANDGPGTPDDVMPLYTDITLGVTETICVNSQFDSGRTGNKLSEHRYLRMNLPAPAQVAFTMNTLNPPSTPSAGYDCTTADQSDPEVHEHSDPDFLVWRDGQLSWLGFSCQPNSEVTTTQGVLAAGDYVIDINEFRHEDDDSPGGFPEQVCFEFTAN